MYFLNIRALERQLKTKLSEHDKFLYFFVLLVVFVFTLFFASLAQWETQSFWWAAGIQLIWVFVLYLVNSKGDNKDFLGRLFSLYCVTSFIMFMVALSLHLSTFFLFTVTGWSTLIIVNNTTLLLSVTQWLWIWRVIRRVSGGKK